ncbi:hypothetical protein NW754_013262 [Fusarium falciforme]|uniref:Uncharacterized protein n=1 Tax=Fusarium falciforme TaxID=195108 RepID=A0A9W8QWG1_9HYPO|nr:hypothetical protein NW754_013262 [Fusarium falciforme]KAJ4179491.1 hypothetical protein NW755_012400 [Fusarium falciforme]
MFDSPAIASIEDNIPPNPPPRPTRNAFPAYVFIPSRRAPDSDAMAPDFDDRTFGNDRRVYTVDDQVGCLDSADLELDRETSRAMRKYALVVAVSDCTGVCL